jgi:ubiquinone/menaquinone biosynthesis C-methylase UbiE
LTSARAFGVDILLATAHGASEVIGIDVEPQLVEAARTLIESKGLRERVMFRLVEPGPLPFPDASFDVVFWQLTLPSRSSSKRRQRECGKVSAR